MTDRQHPPPGGSHGVPGKEEEDKKPKLAGVSTIQVGASAGAAVTSAVAASYFGVGGTLIGAAVGSVVSTVAGALYTESLNKARKAVQTTTAVVVQRFPGDLPQSSNVRRMTGPAGVPVADSLNRVGSEDPNRVDVDRVEVPIADHGDQTQLIDRYDGQDATRVIPPVNGSASQQYSNGQYSNGHYGSQGYGNQQNGQQPRLTPPPAAPVVKSWWRRPGFIMAAISMTGFAIALCVILGTEGIIGHPISGGDSGNTVTKFVNSSSTTKNEDVTPTPTATTSETESASPTATESSTPTPTESSGSATPTTSPTATDGTTGDSSPTATDGSQDLQTTTPESTDGLTGDTGSGTADGTSNDTGANADGQ